MISLPTGSREIFALRADGTGGASWLVRVIIRVCMEEGLRDLISASFMAPLASGTMVKSKCEAKPTRQRMRKGLPMEVSFRSGGAGIVRTAMSCRLGLMKSSTSLVYKLACKRGH